MRIIKKMNRIIYLNTTNAHISLFNYLQLIFSTVGPFHISLDN